MKELIGKGLLKLMIRETIKEEDPRLFEVC